jgi:hypothetical protein
MQFYEELRALQHDHVGTSAMLTEVSSVFDRWARGELESTATRELLSEGLVALRDHVLDHFAAEEEILAPLAPRSSAELRRAIEQLETEHAAICALAVRLGNWAEEPSSEQASSELSSMRESFSELLRLFRLHDPAEQALIESLLAAGSS